MRERAHDEHPEVTKTARVEKRFDLVLARADLETLHRVAVPSKVEFGASEFREPIAQSERGEEIVLAVVLG